MPKADNSANEDQASLFPQAPEGHTDASEIIDRYRKGLAAMVGDQQNYWLNHSFMLGEQWLWYNPVVQSVDTLPRDPDRVQVTVNRMWPASRSLISKLTSRALVFDVPPTGADDATIRAARTSESILTALKKEHDWEAVREDTAWGTWKGGTAAISVEWDSTLGEPLGVRGDGRVYSTGDTVESALSVADFVVQPGVRDAEKGRYWFKHLCIPPSEAQEQFGLPEMPAADASAALTPYQNKLLSSHTNSGGERPDLTRVLTYYERPSESNPQGLMCVLIGEQIVDAGPWPFPFKDKLNLAIVKETRINGRWSGETVLSMARPIQTALNASWSSIVEHMKLAGNARLMVPEAAADMVDTLTDLPSEVLLIPEGSTAASYLSPPQMPAWWIQQPVALAVEMDNVLGHHDVSRGEAPVNIESGLGLSILIEQDSTPLGRMTKEMAIAFGKVGRMVLEIYQENVIETRQAIIKTPGQPAETTEWTGGQLLGQVSADVPLDAVMPRSRAQQLEFAKQALQMGLIDSLEAFVKVADLPDQRDILEALSPDVAKARRENHRLALGQPDPPAIFDDHAAHIHEHLTFMKGPRWETLTPQAQEYFILHNQAHEVLAAELMGRQLAKSMENPLLAAVPDKNGAPSLPFDAVAGMLGPVDPAAMEEEGNAGAGSPSGPGYAPTASSTDSSKKTGNDIASGRMAKDDFQPGTDAQLGGL